MKKDQKIENAYKNSVDFTVREIQAYGTVAKLFFLENLCDKELLSKEVILPLIEDKTCKKPSLKNIKNKIYITTVKEIKTAQEAISSIAKGNAILHFEKSNFFIEINLSIVPKRAISEPPSNNVVRGPRAGFIEDIKTNIGLIRSRLSTEKLQIKELFVGQITQTKVCVCYLDGITDKKVLRQIVEKIKNLKIDGVIDSYYIQGHLAERPKSIFKQCGITERPDIVVAKMLEGRVAIVVDGSPFVLTLPFILFEDFQSSEDYFEESKKVVFMRFLRVAGILLAIMVPGIYLSFQLFHYKALPIKFLITILNSSSSIPLAPLAEMMLVFLLFEVLFEASIRIPKGLGSSFNIVGAIILGDTAIQSSLASAPTVMIVAVSSIAIYLIPDQTGVLRILRLSLTTISGIMGVVGLIIGLVFLVGYLSDFDSYGAVYLGPYAPLVKSDLKDSINKEILMEMKTLPKSIPTDKKTRVSKNAKN